jgi:hypothetical protein
LAGFEVSTYGRFSGVHRGTAEVAGKNAWRDEEIDNAALH